jgi:quinol monooxygenase YgiN
MNSKAKTIDEVIEQLDAIIAESKKNNDPSGFFAYIYRRTTAQIKQAVIDGKFDDNARMEKFDVHFANKYLDAYSDYQNGLTVCSPWAIAFDAKKEKLTILQHGKGPAASLEFWCFTVGSGRRGKTTENCNSGCNYW